jgi:hypothetical protein
VQFTSASYLVGPLLALAGVGVLRLLLRWTYARGGSVVAKPPRPGGADDDGLLVPVFQVDLDRAREVVRGR